jgi:hypothetical protein
MRSLGSQIALAEVVVQSLACRQLAAAGERFVDYRRVKR